MTPLLRVWYFTDFEDFQPFDFKSSFQTGRNFSRSVLNWKSSIRMALSDTVLVNAYSSTCDHLKTRYICQRVDLLVNYEFDAHELLNIS